MRYIGTDDLSFIKGELRYFLEQFDRAYLGLCENCEEFFVKSIKRGGLRRQRFCTRRGRACRDEYMSEIRKSPEMREKRREYMREYRKL